jgi:hypothetical protein
MDIWDSVVWPVRGGRNTKNTHRVLKQSWEICCVGCYCVQYCSLCSSVLSLLCSVLNVQVYSSASALYTMLLVLCSMMDVLVYMTAPCPVFVC